MTVNTMDHLTTLTDMRELLVSSRDSWQRSTVHSGTKQAAVIYYQKRIDAIDYAFEIIATAPKKRGILGTIINRSV